MTLSDQVFYRDLTNNEKAMVELAIRRKLFGIVMFREKYMQAATRLAVNLAPRLP